MSYSVSLEEGTPQPYKMKVMAELLVQAHIIGLDVEEFVSFFSVQIQAMLASPPNFNMFGEKARVWVMRGFYPGTHIFFKLTLIANSNANNGGYYAKVSPMRIMRKIKRSEFEDHMTFDGTELNKSITDRMENSFFGANHQLDKILQKKLKMPRCMSPRGLKVFRYEKKKNEKRR
jgi:hypothetical protein